MKIFFKIPSSISNKENFSQAGTGKDFLSLIKGIYKNPAANIILMKG